LQLVNGRTLLWDWARQLTSIAPGELGCRRRRRQQSMRVAIIGPSLEASGGIGRVMSYLLDSLRQDDVDIRVVDTRGRSANPLMSIFPLLRACLLIALLALSRRIDLVHVNISTGGSTIRKIVIIVLCRLARFPTTLHLHASSYPEFFEPLGAFAKTMIRRSFASAESVIVLTESWKRYVCLKLHLREDRVLVLPNAAPGPQPLRRMQPKPGAPVQLLFLGRLGKRKGVPELLVALGSQELEGLEWFATLAGDGDVDECRAQAAVMGLSARTLFTGWTQPDATQRLLARADLLVLPSHAEGLPMAILEAFAWGVPVLSTRVGGIPEVVTDGVDGLLVAPGDPRSLTLALARLIASDSLRLSLGRSARLTWERSYSIEPYAQRLVEEWHRVVQACRCRRAQDSGATPPSAPVAK